ncbi:cytochrome P450 [Peniophora sp. CONT]|nr:cytochrome P450 [Peniophora sp. CONT]
MTIHPAPGFTMASYGQGDVGVSGQSHAAATRRLCVQTYSTLVQHPSLVIAVALNALAYIVFRYWNSPWRKLPPGPTGYPFIGSLRKFLDLHWLFDECPKYGDVVYLNVAGQPTIILNTQKAASDLLDRRAISYSSRPSFVVRNKLMCGGMFLPFETHNDRWRRQRRIINEGFNKSAAARFHAAEAEEAIRLGAALIHDPTNFCKHYRDYVSSAVLSVTYDRPLHGGPHDQTLRTGIQTFIQGIVDSSLIGQFVDLFPWLAYMPEWMAKWKRDARLAFEESSSFFLEMVDDVEARMKQGTARPCLVVTLLEELERFGVSRLEAAWSAGIMYAAGSETTSGILEWWSLAMIAHPDVQKRAQMELDAVVGRERPPTLADRAHLPYTVAILREVMRWRSGLPVGVPHAADADDFYEGMFIPKGTILVSNILSCNRDATIYGDDAGAFRPQRHLDEQGRLAPAPPTTKEHGHVSFGFGRRICVGQHVAEDTLFIAVAVLLWAFQFSKARSEDGREIEVDFEGFTAAGFLIRANEYKCAITPRFPKATAILTGEKEF